MSKQQHWEMPKGEAGIGHFIHRVLFLTLVSLITQTKNTWMLLAKRVWASLQTYRIKTLKGGVREPSFLQILGVIR